jgi:uncharacterized membrane protein YedE/YeeE
MTVEWAAPVLGLAFGFCLERGGLAFAPKLAAQFYLTDLTVFKVMFSALLTAMLGAFWLDKLGLMDLSQVAMPETFVLPQLVGGALFGAGFLIAGLCPGTSCVAAASGRLDGVAAIAGILAGVAAFNSAYGWIAPFYASTGRGAIGFPELLGMSHGLGVALVTAMALGGFWAAERIERSRA